MTIINMCLACPDTSALQPVSAKTYILPHARTCEAADRICTVSILVAVVRVRNAFINISALYIIGHIVVFIARTARAHEGAVRVGTVRGHVVAQIIPVL